jgi:hypothetical protein
MNKESSKSLQEKLDKQVTDVIFLYDYGKKQKSSDILQQSLMGENTHYDFLNSNRLLSNR